MGYLALVARKNLSRGTFPGPERLALLSSTLGAGSPMGCLGSSSFTSFLAAGFSTPSSMELQYSSTSCAMDAGQGGPYKHKYASSRGPAAGFQVAA